MICVETMTDLAEATLAVKAAREVAPSLPICATMTFDVTPGGFFTIMGVTVEQAAKGLAEAGADVVGSNCGNGIDNMVKIAEEFKKHTSLPVIIQSNAGLPEIKGDKIVYAETPEYMAEACKELLTLGVSIIGGCCGTTPEHIAAIRKVVDAHKS
jgi:5-methyltetrahydrofolate--homocysteine methyltransferase